MAKGWGPTGGQQKLMLKIQTSCGISAPCWLHFDYIFKGCGTPKSKDGDALARVVPELITARLPVQTILRRIEGTNQDAKLAHKRLYAVACQDTQYGHVMQTATLHHEGHGIVVDFADPRALLRHLSEKCQPFGPLLKNLGDDAEAILYMDQSTPGQANRPDHGRAWEAIYWCPLDWPEHQRLQAKAWFTFGYVAAKNMKIAGCPPSAVLKFAIRKFWLDHGTHVLGFHYMLEGRKEVLRIQFGAYLADDLVVYELGSCKGAQSKKPCTCCINIMSRVGDQDDFIDDGYFIHKDNPDSSKWVPMSSAAYDELVDNIVNLRAREAPPEDIEAAEMVSLCQFDLFFGGAGRGKFSFLGNGPVNFHFCLTGHFILLSSSGIRSEPSGVVFDKECSQLVQFPARIFWDTQHNLYSSGGIAQYICNALVCEVVAKEIATLAELDDFQRTVTFPKSIPRLPKTFFQDRIRLQTSKHMKAYASKTMTVTHILALFTLQVEMPGLENVVEMVQALGHVTDLMRLGHGILNHLDTLDNLLEQIQTLMSSKIPESCKIKPHLMRHILGSLRKFRRWFSCFWPERKHRFGKKICQYSYRNVCRTMVAHDLQTQTDFYGDPNNLQEIALCDECVLVGLDKYFRETASVYASKEIRTPKGRFRMDELLLFKNGPHVGACVAIVFVRILCYFGRSKYFCVAELLQRLGGVVFRSGVVRPAILKVDDLLTHATYQKLSATDFYVMIPKAF